MAVCCNRWDGGHADGRGTRRRTQREAHDPQTDIRHTEEARRDIST